jgi:translation initiation factor 6 (eIF-6)
MRRRNHDVKDSLDLLLDTMCNAFGGIVLIAILVALVSSEVRHSDETNRVRQLGTEMLKRRIAQVERDLESARRYQTELADKLQGSSVSNTTALLEQRQQLQDEFQSLTNRVNQAQTDQAFIQGAAAQPADDRARILRTQTADLTRQHTAEKNTLLTTEQNTERLKQRVTALQTAEQKNKARNVVQLRLPKEQVQLKKTLPVIICHDQLYFVYDTTGRQVRRNTYGLEFDELLSGDIKVMPVRGRGVDLLGSAQLLQSVPRQNFYVVCWVYGDSFRTFNQFKQLITRAGYEYGWSPMTPDDFLVLTDRSVTAPPPL